MALLGGLIVLVGLVMFLHPNTSGDVVAACVMMIVGAGMAFLPSRQRRS